MTLTIQLKPAVEAKLKARAAREGRPEAEIAAEAVEKQLDADRGAVDRTAELFAQWRAEDATDDPEELTRRDAELEEFKANMNANRAATGERPLY